MKPVICKLRQGTSCMNEARIHMGRLCMSFLCVLIAAAVSAQTDDDFRIAVKAVFGNPKAMMSPKQLGQPLLLDGNLPENVGPLLTDEWHQESAPYNDYMPLEDSVRCVVGCVALAMGEVMRYHRWPQTYDWDSMLDSYTGSYSRREGEAVAKLLYDCGKAVQMKYGAKASSASSARQPIALVDSFGYDRGIQMYHRDFFRRDEWHNLFHRELAEGRPILICARSATVSHAFVCDGYNADGMYHILWGNPTKGEDGWYNIDYLTPDQPQWNNFKDSPERGLNLLQSICIGIQPPVDYHSERYSFGFSHIDAWKDGESKITVVTSNISNRGCNRYDGRMALALKQNGNLKDLLADYAHEFLPAGVCDTSFTDTFRITLPDLDDGEYQIVPMYVENGEWVEVRASVGTPNYVMVDVRDGCGEVREITAPAASLSLTALDFPDTVMHKCPTHFSISITNNGDDQYCGRVFLALTSPGDELKKRIFQQQGFYLNAGETITREFSRTPLEIGPGTYTLQIFTDIDIFTDSFIDIGNYVARQIVVEPYVIPSGIQPLLPDRYDTGHEDGSGGDIQVSSHVYITDDGRKVLRKIK